MSSSEGKIKADREYPLTWLFTNMLIKKKCGILLYFVNLCEIIDRIHL